MRPVVAALSLLCLGGLPVPEGTPWSFDCTDHAALLNAEHHTLRVYRNEVFARHGRTFKSADLNAHFGEQDWYAPDPTYTDSRLTAADTACVARIRAFEASDYTMWAAEVDLGGPAKTDVTLLANDPRLMGKVRSTDPAVLGCTEEGGGPCKATLLIDAVAVPLALHWRVVMEPSREPVSEVGLSSEEWWHAGVYLVDADPKTPGRELLLRNALYDMVDPPFTYVLLGAGGELGRIASDHVHTVKVPGDGSIELHETTCVSAPGKSGWGTQKTVYRKGADGRLTAGPVEIVAIESPHCAG